MPNLDLNPLAPKNPVKNVARVEDEISSIGTNKIEGAESIPLPSKGVFYTWNTNYWNMEYLQCRQLNYTDEDILTTQHYLEDGTVFNELLKNVIVDPNNFPATGLVPIDRDTILLWLRSTAFGSKFEISYSCPKCNQIMPVEWDISKLEIPKFEEKVYEELKTTGELKINLPVSRLNVFITLPTIGKSMETDKRLMAKKNSLKTITDFYGTGSLMLLVSGVEIDGRIERDKSKIDTYFKSMNLTLLDSRWIKRQVEEKLSLKYDTKRTITCSNCTHVVEGVELPIVHPNFFWSSILQ